MKKNLIALLVIALVSVGLFAANPSDSFTVTTSITGINNMKVTTAAVGAKTFDELSDFSTYEIEDASDLSPSTAIAYLSTQTNNRNGYKISLTVTAMKSTPTTGAVSYINYTIFLADDTVGQVTDNGTAKTKSNVIVQGALTGLTEKSYPIKITVNPDQYAAAVEGSYTGTVTFDYVAN